jgi:hypothetical protein
MANYHLRVTAQRITNTVHTLQDGTTIPADASSAGSYAVTLPTGKTIIMADVDFEAATTPDTGAVTLPLV